LASIPLAARHCVILIKEGNSDPVVKPSVLLLFKSRSLKQRAAKRTPRQTQMHKDHFSGSFIFPILGPEKI
jgi:hypothetical protein